jgi:hypothetical protein
VPKERRHDQKSGNHPWNTTLSTQHQWLKYLSQ